MACLIICFRLFTFQRKGARFRPMVSFWAWLLMVLCFAVMVKLALNQFPWDVNPLMAALGVWLAWLTLSTKGNVAHFFRKHSHDC
ncbi:MAG: phage holin family protein [Agitococcus sp.]|nr:phage holin family protein [Agitococcus sp.]